VLESVKSASLRVNSSYAMLLLLSFGALFIKNPKLFGIAITDVSIVLGLFTVFTYSYSNKVKASNLLLFCLILLFILYEGIGFLKVPDKLVFLKYYARVIKSFLVGFLGYILFLRINQEMQLKLLRFFFYLAIVSILMDTVYSLYYYSTKESSLNIWSLYSALKVSYLYADKNMVAFTISLLMVISNRFFNRKYIFLLWFLTIISLSRSGILVNTLILFYFMGFKIIKPSTLLILLATLVFSVILVYAFDLQQMFIDRLSLNKDLSMQGRLGLQRMGINMWLNSPLTGQGLSGYEQKFYTYYQGGEETPFPHNLYIYILSEQGLVGFLLLAIIFVIIWVKLYKKRLGMLVGAYLLFGMFLFNLSEYHFFFLVGLLLAYNQKSEQFEDRIYPPLISEYGANSGC
jgi:O-antigen ligase